MENEKVNSEETKTNDVRCIFDDDVPICPAGKKDPEFCMKGRCETGGSGAAGLIACLHLRLSRLEEKLLD